MCRRSEEGAGAFRSGAGRGVRLFRLLFERYLLFLRFCGPMITVWGRVLLEGCFAVLGVGGR